VSSFSGNDVVITGGTLSIGAQESVSILGSLTATLSTQITTSDIVTRDSITLTTPLMVFPSHGARTALENTGALGVVPSEYIMTRTLDLSGVTTIIGDLDHIEVSSLSQSEMQTLMQYVPGSYLLNFILALRPAPAPLSPSTTSLAEFIILMMIANAQLSDLLTALNKRYSLSFYPLCICHRLTLIEMVGNSPVFYNKDRCD
jgi:hypothetical protein